MENCPLLLKLYSDLFKFQTYFLGFKTFFSFNYSIWSHFHGPGYACGARTIFFSQVLNKYILKLSHPWIHLLMLEVFFTFHFYSSSLTKIGSLQPLTSKSRFPWFSRHCSSSLSFPFLFICSKHLLFTFFCTQFADSCSFALASPNPAAQLFFCLKPSSQLVVRFQLLLVSARSCFALGFATLR